MKVGLFGGTFDPLHVGHLIVAREVAEALGLDELRLVVANRPPHKPEHEPAPAEHRARMVEAAVAGDDLLRVSRVELERGGTSYTVDTLRELGEREPDVEWWLVMGADQFADLGAWKEPDVIRRLARLAVVTRGGDGPEPAGKEVNAPAGIEYESVEVTRIDVSSTRIRTRLAAGRSVRYLVPEPAWRIIASEGLYADGTC